jgi:hypothetical protein
MSGGGGVEALGRGGAASGATSQWALGDSIAFGPLMCVGGTSNTACAGADAEGAGLRSEAKRSEATREGREPLQTKASVPRLALRSSACDSPANHRLGTLAPRAGRSATRAVEQAARTLLLAAAIGACDAGDKRPLLRIGSKRFTESYILAEIAAGTARGAGDAHVSHQQGIGGTALVFRALKEGSIDVYPDYTGTIAEAVLHDATTWERYVQRRVRQLDG